VWPLVVLQGSFRVAGAFVVEPFAAAGPALVTESYVFEGTAGQRHTLYDTAAGRWELGLSLGAALP
jgi:hypothetical protein